MTAHRPPLLRIHHDELVVDNFAGGGGASLGIEWATGRSPDIAVNHDREAIRMHEANHPETRHFCEDVWQVDPKEACGGRRVALAWFSPDCKHFSKAKGGKPVEKKIRGLAWVVTRWAKAVRPRVIILENVEEFQDWGPLLDDGRPCPVRRGLTFRRWLGVLRAAGYEVEVRELRASEYGTPTSRKRLFVIARSDGLPIIWPTATHGPGREPFRTAAECIEWSLPVPSIFERRRPLADNTLRRIARGMQRYVFGAGEPFLVGEQAPILIEHANTSNLRSWRADEPLRTICAEVKGGHFALVTAFLARHYGGHENDGSSLQLPFYTVTTKDHHALVAAKLGEASDRVRAFMVKFYGNEKEGQQLGLPMHTVTTKDRFGLVHVHGGARAVSDIGMRMLVPRELFRAQGFPDTYRVEDLGLSKTAQVRLVGNSVCPPIAAALVRANLAATQRLEVAG